MEYMLLIDAEGDPAGATDDEREAMFVDFGDYTRRVIDSGALWPAIPSSRQVIDDAGRGRSSGCRFRPPPFVVGLTATEGRAQCSTCF